MNSIMNEEKEAQDPTLSKQVLLTNENSKSRTLFSSKALVMSSHPQLLVRTVPKPTCRDDPSCQQVTPPLSGYPSYGVSTTTTTTFWLLHIWCPSSTPAASVQCCTPHAPYTFGYGYGPPNPYYAPPNPYTYVPYGKGQGPASMILPFLAPLIMLFSSFIFLV
ncbi:unnamed protein product [Sphenostylis stenocarpa]|uniref:Uncharacterized protein n=1 Tax=Sphenostylis stenocarpa TaxID=92480 RepID=A0AA86VUG9_9FABA|nr:unnamed protein product [Sphenostylis stenocarpa]